MGVTLTYPVILANGTLEDATQVMQNFVAIQTLLANNVAASGTNNDITALTALATPIPAAAGGSRTFISSGASTGSANAQVIATTQPTGFARGAGNIVIFNPGFTTTGALQVNVNAQGLANVFRQTQSGPVALVGGEIVAGQYAILVDDGTQFELINPVPTGFGALTNLASAATTDLGTIDSHFINITGTTGITSFGSSANLASPLYLLQFAGAVLLTNSGSLALPGAVNYTTGANDFMIVEFLGGSNWRVLHITVASLPAGSGKTLAATGTFTTVASANIPVPSDASEIEIEISNYTNSASSILAFQIQVAGVTIVTGYTMGGWLNNSGTLSAATDNNNTNIPMVTTAIGPISGVSVYAKVAGVQAGNPKAIETKLGVSTATAFTVYKFGGNNSNTGLLSNLVFSNSAGTMSFTYRLYKIK